MKRWSTLFGWLPRGRRPPTGPLTTKEAADAEELPQKTPPKNDETSGHEQKDAGGVES
jgi:hypothetical protein